ncbi:V-type ATP synthase subunit F [Patescibacteria group bacterium]|nr:V-type ATP synthase subunit F [Patescibacteria group bacterium]
MKTYHIAILGSKDAILGFKAIGVKPVSVTSKTEMLEKLEKLCDSGEYAVLLITEDFFAQGKDEVFELSKRPLPAIIPIPSHRGSEGLGQEKIKRIVEQAVGSDILDK